VSEMIGKETLPEAPPVDELLPAVAISQRGIVRHEFGFCVGRRRKGMKILFWDRFSVAFVARGGVAKQKYA